ncbi:Lead, cadmium, zinc, mercury transporting ATPase [Lactococcus cremoris]|uniref:Cd(2+)-exporting ATPase n=1 Tax=Lactococcus lactis subsp. cremoris TaxID=1359 RepID=A0A1V0PEC0_LACLC|nr:heavy metal translocating P-type ATPase [Lactococcus cremoris]ARE27536.1 heavy metal translocating P-type ATPase [Lactococcus cremoris]EUN34540.1 heavy metal translocating P-type ATPase [Lactococcus cremoris subsp. cremoris HP]KZK09996.1 Lead cadmium zinc and mercury transporting ATPase Copper-translocating P-type ATPase [Lactococcus cremoris]KZK41295.1 Lead cadmium zinc and mercury transporting ATPase Copper-translocating P-type ATPase [Lactococcus cremoris]KZK49731.1 Lead cadmium zinc and
MKNWKKLILVFVIADVALIAYFGFNQPFLARLVVTIAGGVLAFLMLIEMIKTLRSGSYGVDLLAITAIIATLLVGEYWASLIIILMLVGGESLEDYANGRAHRALAALLDKSLEIAHVQTGDKVVDLPLDHVEIGSVLLIRPMEIIPIDGKLLSEAVVLDEASLTGETKPNELVRGDNVLSGAINGNSSIQIETTFAAADSQFQKIVQLVKETEKTPAQFVRLADRYAVPFTIIAYIIAAVAYFISGDPVRIAEVLVVASPCPLILAAPIAFVSGMSRSSQNGSLIKNGTVIEKLAKAQEIFLDKTGTITEGTIKVDSIKPVKSGNEAELLQLVYTVEKSSGHILAKAVVEYAETKKIQPLKLTSLTEVAGLGVIGEIDGEEIKIGRSLFAFAPDNLNYETAFYVSKSGKYIGAVTFSDTLRPEAKATIAQMRKIGLENITMLTGDNQLVADKIAKSVGIENVYAGLMPDEKLKFIQNATHRPAIMIGDGVNDAPALATADIGISIGVGSGTVASEAADIVLLQNDLRKVTTSIEISRDTLKIAKQAVMIGIVICIILMFIAALGVIPAVIGALFQEIIDVVSILYALRALRG